MTIGEKTLELALRPHAVDREEVVRRYPGPAGLVRRILGVVPHAYSYFEIWPPALVTYNLTVPALLDVPKCDMGLGISPDLRALVAHAASRGFGCQYCTAHTAVMGTVIRGPLTAPQISSRVFGVRDLDSLGTSARTAVEYASAIAAVPTKLTAKQRDAFEGAFRADHAEAIVLVAAAMGYLNRFMDSLGTVLETAILTAVDEPLGNAGWDPGKHFDEALSRTTETDLTRPSRVGLLREIPGVIAYERAALANVPKSSGEQAAKLRQEIGFVPYYFSTISREPARRVLAHYWLDRLSTPGVDVSAALKYTLCWITAKAANNDALAAHFAFAAHRAGAKITDLKRALEPPASAGASREAAALALAHATAGTASVLPPALVEALVEHHSPPGIIELLLVLSIACALQRYTATIAPDAYEPEIAAFVAAHGDALGLPRTPRPPTA